MVTAILIDDEPLACEMVLEYLISHPEIEVVGICNDGFEGLKAIQQKQPDLIFLDIQMPKINGFEMLELVDHPPAVIFTTAFDEYAIRAFEHHAIDYLLKPYSQDRFDKAIQKFSVFSHQPLAAKKTAALLETTALSPQQNERIVIRENNNIRIIAVPDILYVEAADDYVRIVTASGAYLKNRTMSSLEKQLPPASFIRIHRSYLVNIKEITSLHPYEKDSYMAILRNGKQLPVSKSGYPKLKEQLGF